MKSSVMTIDNLKPVLNEERKTWLASLKIGDRVKVARINIRKETNIYHEGTVTRKANTTIKTEWLHNGYLSKRNFSSTTGIVGGTKTNPFEMTYIFPIGEKEKKEIPTKPKEDCIVRECQGMIIFEGIGEDALFRYGVSKNQIIYIYPNYDWSTDFEPESEFKYRLEKAKKETCFLFVLKGLINPLENLDCCFMTKYHEHEKATYYHFCGEGEKALMNFYGFSE